LAVLYNRMTKATDLFSTHDALGMLLAEHKAAIVQGSVSKIQSSLKSFWVTLNAHSGCEDELLLPKFVELGLESNGCTAEILSKEHEKLRRLADEARSRVNEQVSELTAERRVYLLESLHMLSEVLEHHDVREREAFLCKFSDKLNQDEIELLVAEAISLESALATRLTNAI